MSSWRSNNHAIIRSWVWGRNGQGSHCRFFVWWDNWGTMKWWPLGFMCHSWQLTTGFSLCTQWSPYSLPSLLSASLFFFHIFLRSSIHSHGCNHYHQWLRTGVFHANLEVKTHSSLSWLFLLVEDVAILQVTHASSPWHHLQMFVVQNISNNRLPTSSYNHANCSKTVF